MNATVEAPDVVKLSPEQQIAQTLKERGTIEVKHVFGNSYRVNWKMPLGAFGLPVIIKTKLVEFSDGAVTVLKRQ
jgi:hypothetical protein